MSKPGLNFFIEGVQISAAELGEYVTRRVSFSSEQNQEEFSHMAGWAIFNGVARKVTMSHAQAEHARVRKLWIALHPPNHAGYYYCHIGGEWVHFTASALDHIVPGSVERINTDTPGWDDKMRMSCNPHNFTKGSSLVESATLEIAPPDGEC